MSNSRKAGSQEFRNKLEERKGTEWYDAAAKKGLHDPRIDDNGGKKMYSGAEVRAEMRHGRDGKTTEEMTKYFSEGYANGTINLNGNAKDFLTDIHGATLQRNSKGGSDKPDTAKDPEVTVPTEPPTRTTNPNPGPTQTINPTPSFGGSGGGSTQNVNQDNDQTSSVVGNGNTVTQTQDNSISQASGLKDRYILNLTNRRGV